MRGRSFFRLGIIGLAAFALALPGKRPAARAQEKPPAQAPDQKNPQYSISVEVPAVKVDAVVTDQDGDLLIGLKKQNFRIFEDGVQQSISNFAPTDAPITIVMLMEFSRLGYQYIAQTAVNWGYYFLPQLGPQDWVALVTYDIKPTLVSDFTRNKQEVQNQIAHLYFPSFTEANEYDAILDTLDRLKDVEGKKSILLLASGCDTFSKHTYDDVLKALKQTDVTIFTIGTAEPLATYGYSPCHLSTGFSESYEQAKNALRSISEATGGYYWFPRFDGEMPGIFRTVALFLRNQYTIAYTPSNQVLDGKFRKIRVAIVDDDGNPYMFTNQKGKKRKTVVYARQGYLAPKTAASN